LKVLKPAASRYGAAPSARGGGAQSFFALPSGMDGMDRHNLMEIMGPKAVAEFQLEQGTSAFAAMVGNADRKVATDEVPDEIVASVAMLQSGDPKKMLKAASVFNSVAEMAMWKATGRSRDCFGCGSPDHFWFRCPHKNDPTYMP